jgi:hypothetical protein
MAARAMIWQDVLLDHWVDATSLRSAVASVFGVPTERVAIVDSPDELSKLPADDAVVASDVVNDVLSPQILVERVRQQRDFPLQLMIALRDEALLRKAAGVEGTLRAARRLAERLGATVLFAEGPLAPSEWLRVRPTGETDVVSLDVDESGDVDSYFVADGHAHPAPDETGARGASRLTA